MGKTSQIQWFHSGKLNNFNNNKFGNKNNIIFFINININITNSHKYWSWNIT